MNLLFINGRFVDFKIIDKDKLKIDYSEIEKYVVFFKIDSVIVRFNLIVLRY